MKSILSLVFALISVVPAYANDVAEIVVNVYESRGEKYDMESPIEYIKNNFIKFELSRSQFSRIQSERISLICTPTYDNTLAVTLASRGKEVPQFEAVITRKKRDQILACNGLLLDIKCILKSFDDIFRTTTFASNKIGDARLEGKEEGVSIMSRESFLADRPENEKIFPEIPLLEIFDPRVHTKVPVKNSIYCAAIKDNKYIGL